MNVEIEADLGGRLAAGGVDLRHCLKLVAEEVGMKLLKSQMRRAPLARQTELVHQHVGQRDALQLRVPIDEERLQCRPPTPRSVGRRLRCGRRARRAAVELKMPGLAPAGLRTVHLPLPVGLLRQQAVRRMNQLGGEPIGPELEPFGLEDAGCEH